jgi:hypothetical protein
MVCQLYAGLGRKILQEIGDPLERLLTGGEGVESVCLERGGTDSTSGQANLHWPPIVAACPTFLLGGIELSSPPPPPMALSCRTPFSDPPPITI